jgi:hypothetical protein
MVNKAGISGVTSNTLSLSPTLSTNAGSYFAVASNNTADATSHVATLTLLPPTFGNGQGSRGTSNINSVVSNGETYLAGQLFDFN